MIFSNPLLGTITILISIICYNSAYRFFKQNKYAEAMGCIVAAGFLLRLFTSFDFFLNPWDERYHALAAKHLIEHPLIPTLYEHPLFNFDYTSWTNNYIWVHKPPLTLWLMALSLYTFGLSELAVRIPSILFSSIGIFLTFYIAKYFFDKRTALLSAFFYSINGLLIELVSGRQPTDHVDTFFIFFVELGVCFSIYYIHKRSLFSLSLIGIATGFALLTKWLPALIVVGILFLLLLEIKPWKKVLWDCCIVIVIAFAIAAPWQWYIFSTFPNEARQESYFNYLHIIKPLDGHDGTFFFHFALMPRIFGELIYIPVGMFFYELLKKKFSFKSVALTVWFIVPYLFFSFVATKMQGYVMMSAPAFFMILAWGFWNIYDRLQFPPYKKLKIALLILLIALPIRYSIERIKPFQNIDRNPGWARELRTMNSVIGDSHAVVFNMEHYIEAMFYTNCIAYPYTPTKEQVRHSLDMGYKVFIVDNVSLPQEIRIDSSVTILPKK